MLRDVAVTGQGVGRGSVVLDADVPSLRALHLGVKSFKKCVPNN